jgi:hypothetical protein
MQYIVTFRERVKSDYNCFFREHDNHSERFDTLEQAKEAASEYCRLIPLLPYRRQATVHNGPVITCPFTAYYESKIIKYPHFNG